LRNSGSGTGKRPREEKKNAPPLFACRSLRPGFCPAFRKSIRIFTPLSALYALSRENSRDLLFPCLGGICYFSMDSRDGHIYPCGYRGDEDRGASVAELRTASGGQEPEGRRPFCKKCHRECFMDPSQLFGIFRYMIRHPRHACFGKALDRRMLRLWFEDVKYYLACDLFDGKKPPKATLMKGTFYRNPKTETRKAHRLRHMARHIWCCGLHGFSRQSFLPKVEKTLRPLEINGGTG
jgi:hypothetical protein